MERTSLIQSKDNPMIRHFRRLCESKRLRRTEQLFVAEGLRLVREALQEQACRTLLITQTAYERFGDELEAAASGQARLCRISDELGRYLSETEHTQGIFAVCVLPQTALTPEKLRGDGRYLVLHELQDPGNVGMILRTADALGIDAVISCRSCEIYSPKVVRATMGAVFRLPVFEVQDTAELGALLHVAGLRSYAAMLDERAAKLTECRLGRGCAVWIGNEGNGLTPEAASACDQSVMIPMTGHAESLNAAMAAGILLWEMSKAEEFEQ